MISGREGQKGMTLPEVLIAGMLGALLLLSLAAAAGNVFEVYKEGKNEADRSRDAAFSLDVVAKQIRNASNASLTNTRTLVLTDPLAANSTIAWSGTVGDPLTLEAGMAEVWTLIDGVKNLNFQLITRDVDVETDQVTNTELFNFDQYSGYEHWEYVNLAPGVICCIEFMIPASEEIEEIRLTKVFVRIGKKSGQYSDLEMILSDTRSKDVPYPSFKIISQTIPNGDIPWASWDGIWKFYWAEIDLDPGFTVYPNRHYALALRTGGSGTACMIRLRLLMKDNDWDGWGDWDPPTGPKNGIRYLDSFDSGATWWPDLGTKYQDAVDTPFVLYGDVVRKVTNTQTIVTDVEVSITLDDDGEDLILFRREQLQGGI